MSDITEAAATEATTEAAEAAREVTAKETDWKAEARKWEQRAKDNSTAAARLAEIEEASKSEAERVAERLKAAEDKAAAYEAREQIAGWKSEVSTETGVPISALRGDTKDEIAAHAAELKSLITQAHRPQPIPGEGQQPAIPLNGDGLEQALKSALGIQN